MTRSVVLFFAVLCVLAVVAAASADPVVPGYIVDTNFASVGGPQTVTFDTGHYLYVGGGNEPDHVYRVLLTDGTSVSSWGGLVQDPDAVLYDPVGNPAWGPMGTLLVGTKPGQIWAIRPDESTVLIYDPAGVENPTDMAFDSTGRLLFVDCDAGGLFGTTGASDPSLLASMYYPTNIAVGPEDRIYIGSTDGSIRVYGSDGSLIEDPFCAFSIVNGCLPVAFGPGGVWGTDLYAIAEDALWRFSAGTPTCIGTGFESNYVDMGFGPDGKLYISDYTNNSIIRVTVPEPAAAALLMLGAVAFLRKRRAA